MRKYILIAALVLASAAAQAGPSRGPTLASNDEPVVTEQPKAVDAKPADAKPAEAPKFVDRPAAVAPLADAPKADEAKPLPEKKAEKPRRRRNSIEARMIYVLHRYGIYW
jgi:hypothetical protein